jgi:hypothetical protein
LTAIVGRGLYRVARGAASLLAARRLGDDPRGSFGAIAGVIMAVFVASAFSAFAAYATSRAGRDTDPLLQPAAVVATLGGPGGPGSTIAADLADRIATVEGVTGALTVREVALVQGDGGIVGSGWLASCPDLTAVLALVDAICPPSGVSTTDGSMVVGPYTLVPDPAPFDGSMPPRASLDAGIAGASRLAADARLVGFLPSVVIDPLALDDPSVVADFPVNRIYITTDGSPGVGERVRSAIVAAAPASVVRLEQERLAANGQYAEIGRIVALGLVGTLILAGCSLAVAITTATLDRRRQFVFLRSSGMAASSLRATLMLQAGVPLAAVAAASAVLGALVGGGILWMADGVVALPDASLVAMLALSLVAAMGIVVLTLPPLERMTRPASLRHE